MPKRAFIIGNGPSLKDTPLDLLNGEITFAVNKFFLHPLFTNGRWKPTHYVRGEFYSWKTIEKELIQVFEMDMYLYLNEGFKGIWRNNLHHDKAKRIDFFVSCYEHTMLNYDNPDLPEQWHPPGVCGFGGSVPCALQIAAREGYEPLYLLGCDLGYKDDAVNHFTDGYEEKQLRSADILNNNVRMAHEIAARSSPVPIYNATIGGDLEAYPRVDLRDIL